MSIQLSLEPVSLPERHDAGRPGECRCPDRRWRSHHDRLLRVESDQDEVVELLELAVTWSELDYSGAQVVPPERWDDFALAHDWQDPERVRRLFGLCADIALRPAAGAAGVVGDLYLLRAAGAG